MSVNRIRQALVAGLVISFVVGAANLSAAEPTFSSSGASNRRNLDCEQRASKFPDIPLAFVIPSGVDNDLESFIRCTARVRDHGAGRKGVKVTLEGEIVPLDDADDTPVSLPTKSGRTDTDGNLEIDFPLDDLPDDDLAVIIEGTFATRKKIDSAEVDCHYVNRKPCQNGRETLCLLNDERFKVEVDWTSSSSSGTGMVISSGFDTGSFYFISPNSTDLLVQLLDKCSNNDHFWVFYQASTSVEFDLTVTDTATGASRVYDNELGQPFRAITDTSAFATCP